MTILQREVIAFIIGFVFAVCVVSSLLLKGGPR